MRSTSAVPSAAQRTISSVPSCCRGLSQVPVLLKPSGSHSTAVHVAIAAAVAPALQHELKQRACCCLAAVPRSAAAADSDAAGHDPRQQQQHSDDALWSDEDIFEAFEQAEATTSNSSNRLDGGGAEQRLQPSLQQQQQAEFSHQHQPGAPPQHSRHQRRFTQQLSAAVHQQQQQHSGLQQLQPVVRSFNHVHLLQRIAGVNSWKAAAFLLQEQGANFQAEHVGLLWSHLTPRLQGQLTAAADRADRTRSMQQQRTRAHASAQSSLQLQLQVQETVLQALCSLTGKFACSMGPHALTAALQGLTAAAAAGRLALLPAAVAAGGGPSATGVVCGCVQLDSQLLVVLQQQVLQVAGSCSPQHLAVCLSSGQQLGWCQHMHTSLVSSSSSSSSQKYCQYCWSVLQAAGSGQLGQLLQAGSVSSFAAAQLMHSLASCTERQPNSSPSPPQQQQQQQQQEQVSGVAGGMLLQQLADCACLVLAQSAAAEAGSLASHSSFAAAAPAAAVALGAPGRSAAAAAAAQGSNTGSSAALGASDAALGAAVCSMQAFALLQHMPDPERLEQLLADLQPHIAARRLSAQQQLAVLQACHDLGVEPWPEWLQDCYSSLADCTQDLQPQQLPRLLTVLQDITSLQPSRVLLHQLAKMTAVHCSRYSLQQLAGLPVGFKQLGFRPQPYWLKDYLSASTALLVQQQQQRRGRLVAVGSTGQQQQQQVASASELAELVAGVGWLSVAAPPAPWLRAVEQALLHAAACEAQQQQQQQTHLRSRRQSHSSGPVRLPTACATVVSRVLAQWGHTPCNKLQQVLSASLQDQHMAGPGGGSGAGRSSSSARVAASAPLAKGRLEASATGVTQGPSSRGSSVAEKGIVVVGTHGEQVHSVDAATAAAPAAASGCGVPEPQAAEQMPMLSSVPVSSTTEPLHPGQPHQADGCPVVVSSSSALSPLWQCEELDFGLDLEQQHEAQQDLEVVCFHMVGQLTSLPPAAQLQGKPAGRSWYRSKLLQLIKFHNGHKYSGNAPALVVL